MQHLSSMGNALQWHKSAGTNQLSTEGSFSLNNQAFYEALPVLDVDEVVRILREIEIGPGVNSTSMNPISMTPLASAILSHDNGLPEVNGLNAVMEVTEPERESRVYLEEIEDEVVRNQMGALRIGIVGDKIFKTLIC
ncbi:hypothetical protein KIN20_029170 [Parelaphostrongylus tenuis]|uniref:Uncharacterized protein n=1 Tax=Parelaphostrongylus tenuis TaxID=148309 RepID=A0AAD5R298_PARTN|nr:hypothetical protein KIN20_029170 [Parelaphostrongylus tenuis]